MINIVCIFQGTILLKAFLEEQVLMLFGPVIYLDVIGHLSTRIEYLY